MHAIFHVSESDHCIAGFLVPFFHPPLVVWGLWHSMKTLLPEAMGSKIKSVDPGDTSELQWCHRR
jgi:hypothetical protein